MRRGIFDSVRRPHRSGTYEKTAKGWRCKIGRKWGRSMPTKAEALRSAIEARERRASSAEGSEPLILAAQRLYASGLGLSRRTEQGYRTLARAHLCDRPIAGVPIGQVTPLMVQRWLDSLPVSATSKARYLETLKAMFSRWKAWGLVESNPCDGVRKPRRDAVSKRILTRDEAREVVSLMPERFRLAVELCAHGLRRGEACAAMREDLDGGGIAVRRVVTEAGGLKVEQRTKTHKPRWVPLTRDCLAAVEASPPGYLTPTASGGPVSPRNLSRVFSQSLKGTRYEGLGMHDLRSSFAVWLIRSGVDVRTASEILGHSPRMLSEVYARSSDSAKMDAIKRVESVQ